MFKKEFKNGENWFNDFSIYVDLGYLGFANDYKTEKLFIPYKKTRKSKNNPNPQLSKEQKEYNKKMGSVRVKVEHAIGGMKRFRCMSDRYRNKKDSIENYFAILSAGLWNFNIKFPFFS
jgi:hypothetical protein